MTEIYIQSAIKWYCVL